jgi:hypothetical protein
MIYCLFATTIFCKTRKKSLKDLSEALNHNGSIIYNVNDFKLDNEPKITSGFTIPDGYFDTFSEKILAQIPIHEPKVISIFNITKTWYFVAAAIVIVMLSIPLYLKYSIKNQELDATTIENYIAYDSSISEDEIVDLLDKEDLVKMKIEFNLQDEDLETILSTNSNLEQYIIN